MSFIGNDGSGFVGGKNILGNVQGLNVDVLGNLLVSSGYANPNTINGGQAYTLSLGNFSSGAGTNNYAVSVFNPNSNNKNILIYSAKAANGSGGLTAYLYMITADTGFTQTNPVNSKGGGPASSIQSTCRIATTNQSLAGTLREMQALASATQELLTNGDGILLPAGASNGLVLYIQTYAAGINNAILKYVEF